MSEPDDPAAALARRLEERLDSAEKTAEASVEVAGKLSIVRREADRSTVTKIVIFVYAASVGIYLAFICWSATKTGDYEKGLSGISDLMKTAVIPIVTFVLGHYFGSSER